MLIFTPSDVQSVAAAEENELLKQGYSILSGGLLTGIISALFILYAAPAAGEDKGIAGLSPQEGLVAQKTGFDRKVISIVKETTETHIHRLTGYNGEGYNILTDGICVELAEARAEKVLFPLRQKLHQIKYTAFITDVNEGAQTCKIGVLKGSDQYDILRTMQTNGNDQDITNDDVIERLKDWEKTSPFDIIGADYDWVEIEFKKLPQDLRSFAEEVSDFCPDAVDEDSGGTQALAEGMARTRRLLLLWE